MNDFTRTINRAIRQELDLLVELGCLIESFGFGGQAAQSMATTMIGTAAAPEIR